MTTTENQNNELIWTTTPRRWNKEGIVCTDHKGKKSRLTYYDERSR